MAMAKGKISMIPIKRVDIFQSVVKQLTAFLDGGELDVGDRLPAERELAEMLGVSRTSIRQALKVLEASGRIETRVGSGTYVANAASAVSGRPLNSLMEGPITPEFMTRVIEARAAVEKMIFEEYIKVADKNSVEQLRELVLENEADYIQPRDENLAGLDMSFEVKVAEFTQNPILMKIQSQVHQLWADSWRQYGFLPDNLTALHQEHLAIIEALETGRYNKVIELVVSHVQKAVV